jgi:hypothetical protein
MLGSLYYKNILALLKNMAYLNNISGSVRAIGATSNLTQWW